MSATDEQRQAEAQRLRLSYQKHKETALAARKARYESNKPAALAKNKEWHEANLDKHRELNRQWAKKNPEAARALVARRRAKLRAIDGRYTKHDIARMMAEQGGCCLVCKADLAGGYNVDHVVPISRGGSNHPENLQLLCPVCNRSKGAKLMSEWLPYGLR